MIFFRPRNKDGVVIEKKDMERNMTTDKDEEAEKTILDEKRGGKRRKTLLLFKV